MGGSEAEEVETHYNAPEVNDPSLPLLHSHPLDPRGFFFALLSFSLSFLLASLSLGQAGGDVRMIQGGGNERRSNRIFF